MTDAFVASVPGGTSDDMHMTKAFKRLDDAVAWVKTLKKARDTKQFDHAMRNMQKDMHKETKFNASFSAASSSTASKKPECEEKNGDDENSAPMYDLPKAVVVES